MSWSSNAIWWHVYPLGFTGAPIRPASPAPLVHRLGQVEAWLDYLIELGCNGLALGPVFASRTHGYDTTDYFLIDPRLGDDNDFDSLVNAADRRGIRVLLDGVFNHVGTNFVQAKAALSGDSAALRWFTLGPDGAPQPFEGHPGLLTLNHADTEVQAFVTRVMKHWLGRGTDGWRLDAAYRVPPEFWAQILPQVRADYPDAWFMGEVIHGDYPAYIAASTLDSLTQYELWKAIWSSIGDHNFFELGYALGRHAQFCTTFIPATFVGNHDVSRIASQISDPRHLGHALATLLTLPGIPFIYAGDEQGLRATKEEREGGDDAVRPVFPAAPGPLPGGDEEVLRCHQRLIALRRRHPWLVNGVLRVVHVDHEQIAFSVGNVGGPDRLVTALNLGDHPWDLAEVESLPLGPWPRDAVGPETREPGLAPTRIPAHSWLILEA